MPRKINEFNRKVFTAVVELLNARLKRDEDTTFTTSELAQHFNAKPEEEKKIKTALGYMITTLYKSDHITNTMAPGKRNIYQVLKPVAFTDIVKSEIE